MICSGSTNVDHVCHMDVRKYLATLPLLYSLFLLFTLVNNIMINTFMKKKPFAFSDYFIWINF